jgi:hypothetical protein
MPQGRTNANDERDGNCLKWSNVQQQSSSVTKRYGHGLDDRRTRVRISAGWTAEYLFAAAFNRKWAPRSLLTDRCPGLSAAARWHHYLHWRSTEGKRNLNYIFTSKLRFTVSSKANLVLPTLNAAVGYCQWRTQEFFFGGSSTNSVEDRGQRERGSRGCSPLVRGSGGSCNLIQEISFHTVKFS